MTKRLFLKSSLLVVVIIIQILFAKNACDTSIVLGIKTITCVEAHCPQDSIIMTWEDNILRQICRYKDCGSLSECVWLADSGDTLAINYSLNGRTFGLLREWYSNRRLKSNAHYNDSGQKHGPCETWREDGTRIDSIVYKNGDYEEIRKYYANGKIRYHANYSDLVMKRDIS